MHTEEVASLQVESCQKSVLGFLLINHNLARNLRRRGVVTVTIEASVTPRATVTKTATCTLAEGDVGTGISLRVSGNLQGRFPRPSARHSPPSPRPNQPAEQSAEAPSRRDSAPPRTAPPGDLRTWTSRGRRELAARRTSVVAGEQRTDTQITGHNS